MTVTERRRLSEETLAIARADRLPDYDRSAPPVIAHLGFGAFAGAHLAEYADHLLRRGRPALIRGVSIRSRRAQDQLEPQDGLFTVAVREPGADMSLQVVGALASMDTGPAAALEAMAAATTRLVTLTITEKGYEVEDEEEFAPSEASTSAPALIALALARRRRAGLGAPVFASLDNLLDNGNLLRARVVDVAGRIDPSLAEWIAGEVCFPNSVVDRMVPAPTERDVEDISSELGLLDCAAVSAERHRSWVIRSADELSRWPRSAFSSSTMSRPSSGASSGSSTAPILPWPMEASWPASTPSPTRWLIPPSPASCGTSSRTRSKWASSRPR